MEIAIIIILLAFIVLYIRSVKERMKFIASNVEKLAASHLLVGIVEQVYFYSEDGELFSYFADVARHEGNTDLTISTLKDAVLKYERMGILEVKYVDSKDMLISKPSVHI